MSQEGDRCIRLPLIFFKSGGRLAGGRDLLFAPDEAAKPSFDPSDAAGLWDLVNRQDWAVCASVQRGMSSRAYTQGWFAPMEDASLDIRRWLLPRMERLGLRVAV